MHHVYRKDILTHPQMNRRVRIHYERNSHVDPNVEGRVSTAFVVSLPKHSEENRGVDKIPLRCDCSAYYSLF